MGVCNSTKSIGEKKEIKTNNQENPKNNNSENINNNNNNNNEPTQLKIQPPKKKEEEKKEEEKKEEEKKEEEKKEEEKKEELKDRQIKQEKGEYFARIENINQQKTLNYFNSTYSLNGEDIVISFGDSFKILDNFFNILSEEHELETNNPKYNYEKFFRFDGIEKYTPRAIGINIPKDDYDFIMNNSRISSWYNIDNIYMKLDTARDQFKTVNDVLFQSLGNKELISDYINEFNNDNFANDVSNLLNQEAEKCDKVRTIHILGNIFNGISIGSLCAFLYSIQNNFNDSLKICHLTYFDNYQHKAFTKIKNYIFGISNLYDHCSMINFFNSPKSGNILSNLTIGERIDKYVNIYNLNRIMRDVLINVKANFVYSNGCAIEKEDYFDIYKNFLFEDCKEGKNHLYYNSQLASLFIYKGNLFLTDEQKNNFSKEALNVVDYRLKHNHDYFNFYHIDLPFTYDFVSNTHQSEYFKKFTEEYLLDFLQKYNIDNFTQDEKEMREDTIYKVNNIINEYKEIWRLFR